MSDDQQDVKSLLLYRNAATMGDRLNDQGENISDHESKILHLEALVAELSGRVHQLQHQVNVMWVKHMGHGATNGDND